MKRVIFLGFDIVTAYMKDRIVSIDLDKARTHVEDGAIAVRKQESEDANYFSETALYAVDSVPEEMPYIQEYREAVENLNFETALDELANLAAYIREYDGDEYEFQYQSSAIDRIEDSAR